MIEADIMLAGNVRPRIHNVDGCWGRTGRVGECIFTEGSVMTIEKPANGSIPLETSWSTNLDLFMVPAKEL